MCVYTKSFSKLGLKMFHILHVLGHKYFTRSFQCGYWKVKIPDKARSICSRGSPNSSAWYPIPALLIWVGTLIRQFILSMCCVSQRAKRIIDMRGCHGASCQNSILYFPHLNRMLLVILSLSFLNNTMWISDCHFLSLWSWSQLLPKSPSVYTVATPDSPCLGQSALL